MMCVSLLVGLRLIDDVSSNFHCFVTHSQHIREGFVAKEMQGNHKRTDELNYSSNGSKGPFLFDISLFMFKKCSRDFKLR